MKKLFILCGLGAALWAAGCASTPSQPAPPAEKGSIPAKPGDTIYVCACATCDCHDVARKPGKCGCGSDLAKVVVTEVKDHVASFELEGKLKTAKLTGKYACACNASCCQMISDKPGKCCCGKDLVEVGK
jgi:hypothetical protein